MSEWELPIVDIGPVPVTFFDRIISVDVVGPNLRIVLGETRRIDGRMVCVPVHEMVRPLVSDIQVVFERMLAAARGTIDVPIEAPLH